MMRLCWFDQSGAQHTDVVDDEYVLDDAQVVWARCSPIVISFWPIGPLQLGELPFKWDWPGGDDDS